MHTRDVADPGRLAERQGRLLDETQYTRLLMWEALETDPDRPVNESLRREFFAAWVDTVAEEQRAALPADLDPAQLVLSEICLTLGPYVLPQLAQLVTGKSVKDAGFVAERQEFLPRAARGSSTSPADARTRGATAP